MSALKFSLQAFGALLLSLTLMACSATPEQAPKTSQVNKPQYHVGPIDADALLSHYKIFAQNKAMDTTRLSDLELLELSNQLKNRKLVVVFGTWCPDSQREVPRLLNLVDAVHKQYGDNHFELQLIATAPSSKRDKHLVDKYELTSVPTIMLFDNGQEVGRIVERPKQSLAADIVNMKL